MTREALADILEHELEDAFPVKNKESLHRYISLLTQNYLKKETFQESIQQNHREHQELRSDIQLIASRMEEGFKRMDVHFEAVEKRFESVDKKFESLDKRFNRVNFFLAFGFTVVTVLITVYQFLT